MDKKHNNSFLSISSEEEEGEENEDSIGDKEIRENSEEHKIKNIFNKGNINLIKNNFDKKDVDKINKKEDEENNEYIVKLRNKLNNNTKKINDSKYLILPPPENELSDYNEKIDDNDEDNKYLVKLINPDNINIKTDNDIKETKSDNNIISINQNEILDKNWEIKYINQMLKKDMKDNSKQENSEKIKKFGGNKRGRQEDNQEENVKSKYSKISTKKKYGW